MTIVRVLSAALALVACAGPAKQNDPPKPVRPAELSPAGAADCGGADLREHAALAEASGTRIALDGVPTVGIACTALECTDGRACCNRCGGEYALIEAGQQVNLRGLPGCGGMDCDVVCEPFGRKPTRRYRFVGTYDHAQRVLQVEKFCATN